MRVDGFVCVFTCACPCARVSVLSWGPMSERTRNKNGPEQGQWERPSCFWDCGAKSEWGHWAFLLLTLWPTQTCWDLWALRRGEYFKGNFVLCGAVLYPAGYVPENSLSTPLLHLMSGTKTVYSYWYRYPLCSPIGVGPDFSLPSVKEVFPLDGQFNISHFLHYR